MPFYQIGPVIDQKMRNLQEIIGFFSKKSVIFRSVCFNNDRVITQHTPTCVENYSGDYYHTFVHLRITSFSSNTRQTLLLGHVHEA